MEPLIGAHLSIAGGIHKACLLAAELGCTAVQIFARNQRRWQLPNISAAQAREFRAARQRAGVRFVGVHASYLINLAAGRPELYRRSVDNLAAELRAAARIGAELVTVHPGSHTECTRQEGLARAADACRAALDRVDAPTMLLIETTAAAGRSIGGALDELAWLLRVIDRPGRAGVCLDTCHVFAAGYDIRTKRKYQETMETFDRLVGLDKLRLIHANDSKHGLGSRRDRHWHIGRGEIGTNAFRLLMNDPRFKRVPKILETPKVDDVGEQMDGGNLAALRGLVKR